MEQPEIFDLTVAALLSFWLCFYSIELSRLSKLIPVRLELVGQGGPFDEPCHEIGGSSILG
jgi:hypothetical protein